MIKTFSTLLATLLAVTVVFSSTDVVVGQLIVDQSVAIDYGPTPTGTDSAGTVWNDVAAGGDNNAPGLVAADLLTIADLNDTSGTPTGVGFSLTNNTGFWGWDFGSGTDGDGALIVDAATFQDGIISNDAPGAGKDLTADDFFTVTFTGLDDTLTYDLVTGYARNDNANFDSVITAGGTPINTDSDGSTGTVDHYAEFTGLTSTDGVLSFTVNGSNDGSNAFHVTIGATTLTARPGSAFLLGDVNLDGAVDFLDISPFIGVLSAGGGFQDEADIDRNGAVDFLDISPFISLLSQ